MKSTKSFNRLSEEELASIRLHLKEEKATEEEKRSLVEDMAFHNCSLMEIATMLRTTRQHVEDHYRDVLNIGHVELKHDLRRLQWDSASSNKGNAVMLIWLGKQYLEQTETPQLEIKKDKFEAFIQWIDSQKTTSSPLAKNK